MRRVLGIPLWRQEAWLPNRLLGWGHPLGPRRHNRRVLKIGIFPFFSFSFFLRAEVTAQTSLFCELLMEPFCHYGFGGPANYNPGDPVMVVELHNCRRHHSKRCHEFRCSCSHYYLKLLSARDITPMNSLDATSLIHSLRLIHSDTSKGASGGPDL